jgi:hypothetical protein
VDARREERFGWSTGRGNALRAHAIVSGLSIRYCKAVQGLSHIIVVEIVVHVVINV